MKTNGRHTIATQSPDYQHLQRLIEQQLQRIARRGFSPKPDNAVPQGWYKRFRQLLMGR